MTNDQFDALLANFLEELESEVISIDPELLNNLPMTVIVQTDVDRSTACAICLKSFIPVTFKAKDSGRCPASRRSPMPA